MTVNLSPVAVADFLRFTASEIAREAARHDTAKPRGGSSKLPRKSSDLYDQAEAMRVTSNVIMQRYHASRRKS